MLESLKADASPLLRCVANLAQEACCAGLNQPLAQNVAEVAWHKTQKVCFNDDGTLDFSVTVSGLGEISWWILGYGDQAEVLRPAKLREMIAARAKSLAALYGPDSA